jgi:hypothetical protein
MSCWKFLKELVYHHIKVDDATIIHGPLNTVMFHILSVYRKKQKDLLNYVPEYNVRQGLQKNLWRGILKIFEDFKNDYVDTTYAAYKIEL